MNNKSKEENEALYKIIISASFLQTVPEWQQQKLFKRISNAVNSIDEDDPKRTDNIKVFIEAMVEEGSKLPPQNLDGDPNNDDPNVPFFIDLTRDINKSLRNAILKHKNANGDENIQKSAIDDAINFYNDKNFENNNSDNLKYFWDDNKYWGRQHHFYNNNRSRRDNEKGFAGNISGLNGVDSNKFNDLKWDNGLYGDF